MAATDTTFDDDLCCRMYEKARKFGPPDMEKSALASIIKKTPGILAAKSFLVLSNESVCGILENGQLCVRDELEIFNAVLRMGFHKCTSNEIEPTPENLKTMLQDVIPLIRFPIMQEQDFIDFVVPTGILDHFQLDVMNRWWKYKKNQGSEPDHMPFDTEPRKLLKSDSANFCESSTTFAAALKFLEDFSAAALYTGNVNVVALSGILCEMQKMMQKMAADLQFTQQDVIQKTGYLEFLIGRAKEEFSQKHAEAAALSSDINSDLQGTKTNLKATQNDLFQTKAQLTQTRSDLSDTKDLLRETDNKIQCSIKNLERKAKKTIETAASELETELKMEAGKTAENFESLRKELKDTENALKESDSNLEAKLQETKFSLKETQVDLRATKISLQQTQSDLRTTDQNLQTTNNNLDSTKENLQGQIYETKSNLNNTKENLQDKINETNSNLDSTKENLQAMIRSVDNEQKQEISNTNENLADTKSSLEKTQKELRETKCSLQKTTTELTKTKSKLDETLNELNNTKSNLETTKFELESTRKFAQKSKAELEGSVQKTAGYLDETKLKFDVRIEEIHNTTKESKEKLGKMKNRLKETKDEISELKSERPVPLGFIYIQFSKQPDPTELWANLHWQEVTDEYAGLFFRALGGSSASFEMVQKQELPRISTVSSTTVRRDQQSSHLVLPEICGKTNYLTTGSSAKCNEDEFYGLQFQVTGTEVRPKNMAVRIWKRILAN